MIQRWLAPALVVALLACLWGSPAAQAARKWSPIAISRDGHHWSSQPTWSVFPRTVSMVPGNVQTRSFYIRNQGPTQARLRVTIGLKGDTAWPSRGLVIEVGHSGHWNRVTKSGQKALAMRVGQGDVTQLQVRLSQRRGSINWSQHRSLTFMLKLRLTHYGKKALR